MYGLRRIKGVKTMIGTMPVAQASSTSQSDRRLKRDLVALRRLAAGWTPELVAYRAKISRVQLWRRMRALSEQYT